MRADAQQNYDRILDAATHVLATPGADQSMRAIARHADVGLATLLRNFPSRDALFEALLRDRFRELTATGEALLAASDPQAALLGWLREFVLGADAYSGVVDAMTSAIADPESPLHAACVAVRGAGAALLARAQDAGVARTDLDEADLFLLAAGCAWTIGEAATPTQREQMMAVQLGAVVA